MDKIARRILNPWWYGLWVLACLAVGYYTGGDFGAVQGALIATVLAHAALLELLRDELNTDED